MSFFFFFFNTFDKINVKGVNMQQLTLDKIGLMNENFPQNPLSLPTQFKVLRKSCCLCYRRQNVSSFTISLPFEMKCMTGFLSLLSLWPINISPFITLPANVWYRHNTGCSICFDLNKHSLTIQVNRASCVPEACDVIFALRYDIEIVPCDFWLSTPGKWFVSGVSQYSDVNRIH